MIIFFVKLKILRVILVIGCFVCLLNMVFFSIFIEGNKLIFVLVDWLGVRIIDWELLL